jgi:ketosteroid isomerase-like protein
MVKISSFLLCYFSAITTFSQDISKEHKDSLDSIVKHYYELNVKVFQSNSTTSDIDAIFDLFTNDFTYVHPKYGGTYSREDLYNGYVRNQKNGGYNGSIVDIKIENKIIGLNAVAVEKRFVKNVPNGTEEEKPEMTLFEFREGKIFRIYEYW